jgi:hypothetical protein
VVGVGSDGIEFAHHVSHYSAAWNARAGLQ